MNSLKGRLLLVLLLMGLSGIMMAGCSDSDGTSSLKGTPVRKIDIIGYYGNSGNALSSIPLITDIPDEYNILIITFANFPSIDSPIEFDIQGPYAGKYVFPSKPEQLISDIGMWKNRPDRYARSRKALVSIGGENGHFPSEGDPGVIKDKLIEFIVAYDLDGLDIDLEGSAVQSADLLIDVIDQLRNDGYLVTAAPEAAQTPLNAYQSIIPLLDWVHPQFYNNGPNAVTLPWVPGGDCKLSVATDWQASQCDNTTNWALVLQTMESHLKLSPDQLGMLFPTTPSAAGSYNNWDIELLAKQVKEYGITHVGTWAIAYDHTIDYAFAKAIAALMEK
jgi:chitinase